MARKRPGRKRKMGERYACGKLKPQGAGPAHTPELEARRRDAVGAHWQQPQAGYALGQLLLTGKISARQHDAGDKFGKLWREWQGMAGVPPRQPSTDRGAPGEIDPAVWERVKATVGGALACLDGCDPKALVKAAVDSCCLDDYWPQTATVMGLDALRTGLDALADFFRIPREQQARISACAVA
jgi:hypothetical protein